MARDFTGGNNTTQLTLAGLTAPSAMTVGCWVHVDTWVTGRTIVGLGTSLATFSGLSTGSVTAQRFGIRGNMTTSDVLSEVAAPATGAWICVVARYAGSTAANAIIWTGSLTSPMAAQTHVLDTNGSGSDGHQTTGVIGRAGSNTTFDGRVAYAFCVPWPFTVDLAERFRQGDWSVIWETRTPASPGTKPTFFVPMTVGTAATYDLVRGANWTVTSTPTVSADPPIAAGWGAAGATWVETELHTATEYPQDVGDGSITPAGAAEKLVLPGTPHAGAITPTGALTSGTVYARTFTGNA